MPPAQTKSMLEERPMLMLMDGHALVHRAWHGIREPLTVRKTGEEVRGVYGFVNTLLRAISEFHPTHCAITFDVSAPTFRHKSFDDYKAHRPPTPPDLKAQFTRVREFMDAFKIPIYEAEGFEADDVIGTLSKQAEENDIEVLILTGDTDTLQLVTSHVRVLLSYSVQKRTLYDVKAVRERYNGLGPELVPDIKGLEGDKSDNIPGVPSIGKKTAIQLLTEYGSVEGIYEHVDEIKPPRRQQVLRDNQDVAENSKWLATISREAPVTLDVDATKFWDYDRSEVVDLLREVEFFSMVERIPDPSGDGIVPAEDTGVQKVSTDYEIVRTPESLSAMVDALSTPVGFAFDTETTSTNPMMAELVGLSFANEPHKSWYVPVGHEEGDQLPMDDVLAAIKPLFEAESVPKTAHNANYDVMILANYDIEVQGVDFDSMIAAHMCGRKSIGLKQLSMELLNEEMTPITDLIGRGRKQITMAQVSVEDAAEYAAADADIAWRLAEIFKEDVEKQGLTGVLANLEMPLLPVLVKMQRTGIALDVDLLQLMSGELGEQMGGIRTEMYEIVGHEFNLNSSQQLSDLLFKELRLPPTKRTQKGYSTDASSLDTLKGILDRGEADDADPRAYNVLNNILDYRQVSKIKSTYVDALPSLVHPVTGRIHTSYNQTGSATGRVSSNDPNVQNIPVRTELGRRVREAFIAENAPENTLLCADYSQIELRILAHLSQDPGLLEAFHGGEDIHAATASSVFDVPIDEVDAEMRRIAKIMNFGVIYGLSAFGISQQTGLPREEGAQFIQTYFGKYPGIESYIESTKQTVKERGYVETLNGRRRYISEVYSSNVHIRNAGQRMAINMPIQGTAADILKIAMVRIQDRLDDLELDTKMIVQVHDELIFESPRDEVEQVQALVLELMPSAMSLDVDLEVEMKTGHTWGAME